MQRHVDATATVIEPDPLGDFAQERSLLFDGKTLEEPGVGLDRRGEYFAHEGRQPGLEFGEEPLDRRGRQTRVVLVDLVIVGPVAPAEIGGLAPRQFEMFFEIRRELLVTLLVLDRVQLCPLHAHGERLEIARNVGE